jgi:hypothetical protein
MVARVQDCALVYCYKFKKCRRHAWQITSAAGGISKADDIDALAPFTSTTRTASVE